MLQLVTNNQVVLFANWALRKLSRFLYREGELDHLPVFLRGSPRHSFLEAVWNVKLNYLCHKVVYCLPFGHLQFFVRACTRAAAFHGSRFAPVCSALLLCHRCERPHSFLQRAITSRIQDLIRGEGIRFNTVVTKLLTACYFGSQ